MKVTELVLHGAESLSDEELEFLTLAGQLSNEITMLSKLLENSSGQAKTAAETKANSVLIVLLAKALATKIWQGWELIDRFYTAQRSRGRRGYVPTKRSQLTFVQ